METFVTQALTLLPIAARWGIFVLAVSTYTAHHTGWHFPAVSYRRLASILAAFYGGYAALLTIGQYALWSGDWWGRHFLNTPLDVTLPIPLVHAFPGFFGGALGYFLFYSWGRFWLGAVLAVGVALLFWWFLRVLKRHNERFFEESETELGFLAALIAGWPQVLIFLAVTFLAVVLISIARMLFFKKSLTTLGLPFLIGACAALAFGGALAALLGVGVLMA
ncbi:hypothetical protein COU12_00600 [Candidatus Jorgensenbacteria bacterium CG10_big_fil_rev_8_21_14_0_10_54_38]|uniref:Uncharacterized protein n=2 Tax=Candidatus Joergenseniibacteriota TaxID=1752739 RepID=A0A2M6WGJ9_9BACT|nr:MAG: hypothetical protein COX26_02010 [Candidatus Jorgensenbacteria bacterium CG23_combo_of_CG06-09_8_20_14_all_54_14]PIT91906.1 MAG: hypothetical protein COU12_00600 [Candidatus Jorgensenbacteria bacterium CG10_big_fil_rev_8_21_14_0_10_54_38]